jgi:branched-chain amino acid transport system substrate-binding protein
VGTTTIQVVPAVAAGISGDTLTIYSSLPLQGTSKGQSEAVINGEKLALKEVGNKVGKYKIDYVSLDDSTAQNPGRPMRARPRRTRARPFRTERRSSTSASSTPVVRRVSLPILNKANIPQISPSNTYVGLTTDQPGSEPGEPDKYYPAQKRTYARIVPYGHDSGCGARDRHEGGRLQVRPHLQRQDHLRSGPREERRERREEGRADGRGERRHRQELANYRSLASKIKADCFVGSGVTGENYVQVFKDVAAACPNCKLYGPDGVAEAAFSDPKEGGIPADVGARTKVTVATLSPAEFEKKGIKSAAKFFSDFKSEYGVDQPDPYAIYGYETMKLALDSLKAVGDKANDREAVRKQLLENTKGRDSVLASTTSTRTATPR